jgi:HD superfamily phosphodiesterase
MKEKFNKDTENLRKNNWTEILKVKISLNKIKNTGESHSNRLEHLEDRISRIEDIIEIKAKTEELLGKRLKSYERITQELSDSIKRPNLWIIGIEEETCKLKGHVIYSTK